MAKDSTGLILLAGGAAVAYYGYTQGWFASWGLSPTAAATPAPQEHARLVDLALLNY